jgi:Cu(I)/Ag(I) efflux system periplasmic protein CusF
MNHPARRRLIITALLLPAWSIAARAAEPELIEGEVRRINRDTRKITLRHGAIPSLDMEPMSMVFVVRDPLMLDSVKVGDKVEFSVAKEADGSLVVTSLRPRK